MSDQGPSGLEELPAVLPIFPLTGALLLTTGQLPLNVFEPRYMDLVRDVMEGHRVIGIIQPKVPNDPAHEPDLYSIGCAGKICEFSEHPSGIYQITLEGICRFQVQQEIPERTTLYRQVVADYDRFNHDRMPCSGRGIDRNALQAVLKHFLELENEEADWEMLNHLEDDNLINSLSMICPFSPAEKQALLEAENVPDRCKLLIDLLTMMMQQSSTNKTLQ
ncbi:LON peptidase substrate-binding domain-containing protein [Sneathiella limimaris]|uniref:LON peptidase substrate-binding domain-containing protein n=1 Tax=Sneathiella limimaris TaxID=1964213 RepID=UPI00146E45B3|nr:LON peptidase substrate-binding domain-containing protein [Sneathiella limimaris]